MKRENVQRIARAYAISIGVWCALSLLTGWQYRIFDKDLNIKTSLLDMLLLAEGRGLSYALMTPPIFFIVRREMAEIKHPLRYFGLYVLLAGPFMLLYSCIRWTVQPPWDSALQRYVSRSVHGPLELIRSGFADQITMYIAIVFAAHAYQYFVRVRKQQLEGYELRRALAAGELQALKMQLHPHFLFNTLHGISTLIDIDRSGARAMIVKLSNLLRLALEHGSSDLVPLQEELNFVGEYLDLEKMRLGDRLSVEWNIEPATRPILVPQLILQPLAENAIQHGVACSREGGWVRISSRRRGGTIEISMHNSIGGTRTKGMGVGLKNTEARMKHLYAGDATFCFEISGDNTATATLVLPALGARDFVREESEARTIPEYER